MNTYIILCICIYTYVAHRHTQQFVKYVHIYRVNQANFFFSILAPKKKKKNWMSPLLCPFLQFFPFSSSPTFKNTAVLSYV